MKTIGKFTATGLLCFVSLMFFIQFIYILCLLYAFSSEASRLAHVPLAVCLIVASSILYFATLGLCKRWNISFWHRISFRAILALILALSVGLMLFSRPSKILSRELASDGKILEYKISEPGLGSSGWTIRKENNLPLETVDKLAIREVQLYYYWRSDDNVANESFVMASLVFSFFYLASIRWRILANRWTRSTLPLVD